VISVTIHVRQQDREELDVKFGSTLPLQKERHDSSCKAPSQQFVSLLQDLNMDMSIAS